MTRRGLPDFTPTLRPWTRRLLPSGVTTLSSCSSNKLSLWLLLALVLVVPLERAIASLLLSRYLRVCMCCWNGGWECMCV
jgi:hypothetical protein